MNIQQHFELIPLISAILWLIIASLLSGFQRSKHPNNLLYNDFLPQLYFKIFAAIGYGLVYTVVYKDGGDTLAYWDGAVNLNKMFWQSPSNFFTEMFTESDLSQIQARFNSETGYPPGWIYREPESFFVSKILVFFTFITFKSYWATSILLGYLSGLASWKFYLAIEKFQFNQPFWLKFGVLYIPSVAFWCSGISKDTFVYMALCLLIAQLLNFHFDHEKKPKKYVPLIVVAAFLIFQIRVYVLVALIPALLIAYDTFLARKNKENKLKKWALKTLFYSLGAFVLLVFIRYSTGELSVNGIFNEVITIQQDFATNAIYGDNRYDLNITDYSVSGIVRSIPSAILAAFYRPFPWEATSLVLVLNGLESLILLLLTFYFFSKNLRAKLRFINKNELFMFALIFILIMGFSVGFTSGLFGVLVRLKSVILPFLVLLLSVNLPLASEKEQ